MERVRLHDKEFVLFISREQLDAAVGKVATEIAADLKDECPLFVVVLGGAFLFAADLVRSFPHPCEVEFIRVASYEGTSSTGKVKEILGLNKELKDRHVIVVEDIVDSGLTLDRLYEQLKERGAKSMRTATCLYKPAAFKGISPVDYVGMEVPNNFLVGYGLDYNGLGRNLDAVYSLPEND